MKTEEIPNSQWQPFMFLEGGVGFNDLEEDMFHAVIGSHQTAWEIDNLYKEPLRLACIDLLKPKTLVLGTTGLYAKDLKVLISVFFGLDLTSVKNIILTLNTEDVLYSEIRELKEKHPDIKVWKVNGEYSINDSKKFNLYEIYG